MGFVEQIAIETERQLEGRPLLWGVDLQIPSWLMKCEPDVDGYHWFYNLKLGIYEKEAMREDFFRSGD